MKKNILITSIMILLLVSCGLDNNEKTKLDNTKNQVIVGGKKIEERGIGKEGDTGIQETIDGFNN